MKGKSGMRFRVPKNVIRHKWKSFSEAGLTTWAGTACGVHYLTAEMYKVDQWKYVTCKNCLKTKPVRGPIDRLT